MRSILLLTAACVARAQVAPKAAAPEKQAQAASYKQLTFPPLRDIKPPAIVTATLPNGMRLYLLENRELPLISGRAVIRTGNLFDSAAKAGLAEFTGSVMRSGGTKTRTGDEIDEALENIAASVESGIGESIGEVSFSTLKERLEDVLPIFKDVLTAPEFRNDKIELLKTQYRSAISRRNDDADGIVGREYQRLLYGPQTPYGRQAEYENIDNIGRDDLIAFHKRYFFPANTMLSLQGDFDVQVMKARIEKLFADWTAAQAAVPPFPAFDYAAKPGVYLIKKEDVKQSFISVGHIGGLSNDKDYAALEVMGDILGGGFSSRLFSLIRTQRGYAYNIGAGWGANFESPGLFTVSGSANSSWTVETLQLIKQEIERIRTSEVTDQELRTAKDKVLNSFVFSFDHPGKTLRRMVNYDYHKYPKDFLTRYHSAIDSVTKADILRVAKERLQADKLVYLVVGKPAEFGKPLSTLGPVTELDITIPEPKAKAPEATPAAAGPKSAASAKELLLKAQAAAGGAEKLAAVKDYRVTSSADVMAGQSPMKSSFDTQWIAPDLFRKEQTLPIGKVTAIFDGKYGWLITPQGTMAMPGQVLTQVRFEMFRSYFALLLSDRDAGRTITLVDAAAIEIKGGGLTARVTMDPATGLLQKITYSSALFGGPPADIVEVYSDYRDVGGIKVPFATSTYQGAVKSMELKVQGWKVNGGLNPEEVTKRP